MIGREADAAGVLEGPDGERVEFDQGLSVGRHPASDLVLDDSRVSLRHAAIEWAGGRWRLRDLGSSNGTWRNGRRVKGDSALKVDDLLSFARGPKWTVRHLGKPPNDRSLGATEGRPSLPPDLALRVWFESAEGGVVLLTAGGTEWRFEARQRFVLIHELAQNAGTWVDDTSLKRALWGASGATQVDRSALHKLLHDVRKLLAPACAGGQLIEKSAGRTRLALSPQRVEIGPPTRGG